MIQLIYLKSIVYKFIQSCAGDHRLDPADRIHKIILPAAVQFGENIIQHQDRLVADQSRDQLNFRKFQRESTGSLLPLGTEFSQVYIVSDKSL